MWTERVWLLLNILAPSVSFLLFREASFMPGLYVVQQLAQQMALYAVTIRAGNHVITYCALLIYLLFVVLPVINKKSNLVIPMLLCISLGFFSVRCVLEAFEVVLNGNSSFTQSSIYIYYFAWLTAIACGVCWGCRLKLTWKSVRNYHKYEISHDAYQGLVFFSTLTIVTFLGLIVNISFKATTWSDANEACLVSYVYIQLVASVLCTG